MTETDYARAWGAWLDSQLKERAWRQADLVHNSGGMVKRDRASKWLSGNERPSYRLAVVVANTLGVTHEEALEAAGYAETVEDIEREARERGREYGARMRRLEEAAAKATRTLQDVPSEDLIAEIQRRLAAADDLLTANVPALGESKDDYGIVARARSSDRGEDLL